MKNLSFYSVFALLLFSLTSCEAVGAVFEAGKWYGIFIAVIIVALLFFLFGRGKK